MLSSCEMAISTLDMNVSLDSSSDLLITLRSLKLYITVAILVKYYFR